MEIALAISPINSEEPCKLNADPNDLDDQGGDGAALYPHGQPANKKKVQYGIQNAAKNTDQHTDLRFSVHTEKHSQYRTNHHQGIGEKHDAIIPREESGQFTVSTQRL